MKGLRLERALVVYNKPRYQIHILENKEPHFVRLFKQAHPSTKNWKLVYEQHQQTLEGVERTLKLLGIQTELLYRKKLKKIGKYDLVVTVGGDGTFLETSHLIDRQVLLGVNAAPIDSVGALCRARMSNFLSILIDLLTGERKPVETTRLKVKVGKKTLPWPVVNEVLFTNQSPAGTSRYFIEVGKLSEEHKSSGVWVSTPTGSTAAIHSAGGKVIPLTRKVLQYAVRELLRDKRKKYRLLQGILPKSKSIRLYPTMRQAALYIDGNHLWVPIPYGERVEISASGKPLRAIL